MNTGVGILKYVRVTGEGTNTEIDSSKPPRMVYQAAVLFHKDSQELKDLVATLTGVWMEYQAKEPTALGIFSYGDKNTTKCAQLKPYLIKDPEGTIDPVTGKVAKLPTDYVMFQPYTNTTWPSGDKKVVQVFVTTPAGASQDVTNMVEKAAWSIGDDSEGLLYFNAVGNTAGNNKAKLTCYLSGVHLAKLVKYTGGDDDITVVDVAPVEGGVDMSDFTPDGATDPAEIPESERPAI